MAQAGEWDALLNCELDRRELMGQLRTIETMGGLVPEGGPSRDDIVRTMTEILEMDRQTGELATAWMARISNDLGELDLARKVSAAYGIR